MAYNDITTSGVLWFLSQAILYVAMWVGGIESVRLGAARSCVRRQCGGLRGLYGTGHAAHHFRTGRRETMCYLLAAFGRGFSGESDTPVAGSEFP